ncbi:hypothetical protein MKX03_009111, partial [Papaver bracteatum]
MKNDVEPSESVAEFCGGFLVNSCISSLCIFGISISLGELLSSVTHKLWLSVEIFKLSCANQQEVKLDLLRDAHSG